MSKIFPNGHRVLDVLGRIPDAARAVGMRDRLSDLLQLRHPGHEDYVFHLSIAYLIRYPDERQRAALAAQLFELLSGLSDEFELGAPEFCRFADMFAFHRQFFLRSRERGSHANIP
ncbi:hypothetical protein HJB51_11510 [Rhizobium lentis]|uniref:hypothetical protein n=1 Tax=Rhizobium lentis TaxID=1138194 RepID=UPI001C82D09D|nr:hypothetical protein [Rhizobium lentis]MBX5041072.1 hypothetical protein [Rhizobium lentis]MBX5051802.1 hypothetical protein [Rhizobium lentis]MBX5071359.1 hypothetical protein [Rhizobium lentis]MBX5105943.1 hypothetical protein [Rhizobium lentis]MBX5108603.1 hypothetical protein [Rhizobium lentis]